MRRREVLALLGGTAAAWPVGSVGQQTRKISHQLRFIVSGGIVPVLQRGKKPLAPGIAYRAV
jgi:hypothetical protein